MRRLLVTALMVSAASSAAAQDAAWSDVKSCSIVSSEPSDAPRVRLTTQVVNGEAFLSAQVITKDPVTTQAETFGSAKITIEPANAEFSDLYGWTRLGTENLVGLGITTDHAKFLSAVAAGNEMRINLTVAGKAESFTIPLRGSRAAVETMRRCLR